MRFAEGLGFARVWIPDGSFFKDPFAILGALAQRVQRHCLALGVVNPYTRHPALVARGAGTGGSHALVSFDHRKNLERAAAEVAPHPA